MRRRQRGDGAALLAWAAASAIRGYVPEELQPAAGEVVKVGVELLRRFSTSRAAMRLARIGRPGRRDRGGG